MKCYNTKHIYCYCDSVLESNDICPIKELKKIIDKYRATSRLYTDEFINEILAINLIMKDDKKVKISKKE